MQISKIELEALRAKYKKAVEEGRDTIHFKGQEFYVGYLKYLLQYLDSQFEAPGDRP